MLDSVKTEATGTTVESLTRRLEALERMLTEREDQLARARQALADLGDIETLRSRARFFELSLDMLAIADSEGYFRELSPAFTRTLGYPLAVLQSEPFLHFVHPEDQEATLAAVAQLASEDVISFVNRYRRVDGQYVMIEWNSGATGADGLIFTVGRDITARCAAEETIRRQSATLLEVSTPLIPISDDIVVAPLIGAFDRARSDRLLSTVLAAISGRRARAAILDITGVGVVDSAVAGTLVALARAAQLLGARVYMTGIRPEVARALIVLGVELRGIVTCASLQDGIRAAMQGGAPP